MNDTSSEPAPSDAPQSSNLTPVTEYDQEPSTQPLATPENETVAVRPESTVNPLPQTSDERVLPQAAAPLESPTPPKKKRPLVAAIIAAVLFLLLGGGGAAYAFWYQNPERVVNEAMLKLVQAENLHADTLITSESELATGFVNIKIKKFELNTAVDSTVVAGEADGQLTVELNGREYALGAKGRLTDDKTMYFQIVDVKDLYEKLMKDFGGDEAMLPASLSSQIESIQNKWVKVVPADFGDQAESVTCTLDTMKRVASDKQYADEAVKLYRENQFVKVGDAVKSQDGNLGYKIELNHDALKTYLRANESSKLNQELKKCPGYEEGDLDDVAEELSGQDAPKVELVVWISRFSHELRQVDYTVTSEISGRSAPVVFKGATKLFYDNVAIEKPADAMELKDWAAEIEKISESLNGTAAPSVEPASGSFPLESMNPTT